MKTFTISLTPEEVSDIIKEYFKEKSFEINEINPKLIDVSGYGEDYEFDGYEIKAKLP